MRFLSLIIIVVLCALFQSAVFATAVIPDLVLIVVILTNLFFSLREGIVAAIIGGVVLDLYSGFFGVAIMSLFVISYILHFAKIYFFTHVNILIFLVSILLGTILYVGAEFLFIKTFFSTGIVASDGDISFKTLIRILPLEIIYNLLVAIIIFSLFGFARKYVQPLGEKWI